MSCSVGPSGLSCFFLVIQGLSASRLPLATLFRAFGAQRIVFLRRPALLAAALCVVAILCRAFGAPRVCVSAAPSATRCGAPRRGAYGAVTWMKASFVVSPFTVTFTSMSRGAPMMLSGNFTTTWVAPGTAVTGFRASTSNW